MIQLEEWHGYYDNVCHLFSSLNEKSDQEILSHVSKLNDLVLLYHSKALGDYAYHKKLSILINISNITTHIEKLSIENNRGVELNSEFLNRLVEESNIESQTLKKLAVQQEIENAIDSHEIDKARELLKSAFVNMDKMRIYNFILFKYCHEIKEEISAVKAIELLKEMGVNFNQCRDEKGYTPLMEASENNEKLGVLDALIHAGASPNIGENTEDGMVSPLHLAACHTKPTYVEFLLSKGADPQKTFLTLNVLAEKKSQDNFKIVKMLIDAGIPLTQKNNEGLMPLQIAILNKNTEIVKHLLSVGVLYDDIVLDVVKSNNVELLEFILETYSVSLPEEIPYFTLPYQSAFGSGISLSMFQYCLEKNMLLNHYTFSDEVVLKSIKAVKICLDRKDPMDLRFEYFPYSGGFKLSENGSCALAHFAATCATDEPLAALILAGLDVMVRDKEGRTPLHYAAAYSNPDAVRVLILASADISATDENGKTPLHWAVEHGMSQS